MGEPNNWEEEDNREGIVTDPMHGVPDWAWNRHTDGVPGAKLAPPNHAQGIVLYVIMEAIKGG